MRDLLQSFKWCSIAARRLTGESAQLQSREIQQKLCEQLLRKMGCGVSRVRPPSSDVFSWIRRHMPLQRQTRIASALIPARFWYGFALAVSRWQGRLVDALGGNGALSEAMMRDHWLRELSFHGAFPIPWRLHGREVLDEYAVPGPVLYYNTHLPMVEIPLRVLMELGYPMPVPVADPGRIVDDEGYIIAGMPERVPAVAANSHVLARLRTLLTRGTPVACLADNELGGELFLNPLRLAARLRVPVLFCWAELAGDGIIDVTFRAAPHPFCETEAAIQENLQFLRELSRRVLGKLGASVPEPVAPVPVLGGDDARAHERLRGSG